MKLNFNKQNIIYYISAFIGLILISTFIFVRFIRTRVPRDIPFILNWYTFLLLCIICLISIYLIYRYYKPKVPNKYVLQILEQIARIRYFLETFDDIIKQNNMFTNILFKFFYFIILKLKLYYSDHNYKFFVYINIVPRFVLLGAFILDIFYFQKLQIFYYFIILGLIPLLYEYICYSIQKEFKKIKEELEPYFWIKILSTKEEETKYEKEYNDLCFIAPLMNLRYNEFHYLDLGYFINLQACNYVFDYKNLYKYQCIESYYAEENNIIVTPIIYELIEQTVYFEAFIEIHKDLTKPNISEKYQIYMLFGYFISWMYILIFSILSYFQLPIETYMVILEVIIENIPKTDPFSEIIIEENER